MKPLTAAQKGIATGIAMIAAGLILFYQKVDPYSPLNFISYFLFGLGIVWALFPYSKQQQAPVSFGFLFNQGFRCFIVVTLIMALYTYVFYKGNEQLINEKAALTRTELLKTEKNRTPQEIDTMIESGKKNFAIMATSVTIFQYLLIGAVVTAATAGILSLQKKK